MNRCIKRLTLVAAISVTFVLAGCGSGSSSDPGIDISALWPVGTICSFTDITSSSGAGAGIGDPLAARASWADYDGDGYTDLLLQGNKLYHNNGNETFTEVSSSAGISGSGASCWGDFNNDGHLDFYSVAGGGTLMINDGDGTFTNSSTDIPANPYPSYPRSVGCADFTGDGYLDLYVGNYEDPSLNPYPDIYYTSDGDGTFTLAWEASGGTIRNARGIAPADYDNDGDIDIYVSNYRLLANFLWDNNGSGAFNDEAASTGAIDPGYSGYPGYYAHTIGSAWGDYNNDGFLDLLQGNFAHSGQPTIALKQNQGGNSFIDVSTNALGDYSTRWQESYASVAWADFNNDGYLDFFITVVYAGDKGRLYMNNGDGTFTDVTSQAGGTIVDNEEGYAVAWADMNNDGFLDMYHADGGGSLLLKNNGNGNNWLKLKLIGDGVTTDKSAIGARATIVHAGLTQTRQVEGGTGAGCQNDLLLHFGMGQYSDDVTVTVSWPYGLNETFSATINQTNTLEQGNGN